MTRPCLVPRCPDYALDGQSYCAEHLYDRPALRLTGRTRPKGWARLRRQVMRRQHGRCICGARATVVHHKRSAYDNQPQDLIALCDHCHDLAHTAGKPRSLKR